jgi:hypothetical protein
MTVAYIGGVPLQVQDNGDGTFSLASSDGSLSGMHPDIDGSMQTLTVDNTIRQFSSFPDTAGYVYISVATAPVRMTLDGSSPTTTVGHVLATDTNIMLSKEAARRAKFLRTTGTSGVLTATPLRGGAN